MRSIRHAQLAAGGVMDRSELLYGNRNRAIVDAAENAEELRVGDLQLACVAGNEVANARAQWWNPESRARWDATHASLAEGADAAISVWIAGPAIACWAGMWRKKGESCMGVWRMPPKDGDSTRGGNSRYFSLGKSTHLARLSLTLVGRSLGKWLTEKRMRRLV